MTIYEKYICENEKIYVLERLGLDHNEATRLFRQIYDKLQSDRQFCDHVFTDTLLRRNFLICDKCHEFKKVFDYR